jgi:hypothetical protein
MTGYAPILPLVLREKGFVWRFGNVRRGYEATEPTQRDVATSAIRRAAGSALDAVGAGLAAADRAASRWVATPHSTDMSYAGAMIAAVKTARDHARAVVVAVSPADSAEQAENLRALTRELQTATGSPAWLKFVDLGADPRLRGRDLRLDGWNYGGVGTTLAAEALTPTFLSLIEQR